MRFQKARYCQVADSPCSLLPLLQRAVSSSGDVRAGPLSCIKSSRSPSHSENQSDGLTTDFAAHVVCSNGSNMKGIETLLRSWHTPISLWPVGQWSCTTILLFPKAHSSTSNVKINLLIWVGHSSSEKYSGESFLFLSGQLLYLTLPISSTIPEASSSQPVYQTTHTSHDETNILGYQVNPTWFESNAEPYESYSE